MKIKSTSLFICLLSLASCQSSAYDIDIDAVSKTTFAAGQTFTLKTSGENQDPLLKGQFEDYVARGLVKKGFLQSESSLSDIVIHLEYAVSEPYDVEYTYRSPIIGRMGIYNSCKTQYGVIGYVNKSGRYTNYTRHFSIEAFPQASAAAEGILWRTSVESSGRSHDLRTVLPILVVASWQFFGEDSGGGVSKSLSVPSDMTKLLEYVDLELQLE